LDPEEPLQPSSEDSPPSVVHIDISQPASHGPLGGRAQLSFYDDAAAPSDSMARDHASVDVSSVQHHQRAIAIVGPALEGDLHSRDAIGAPANSDLVFSEMGESAPTVESELGGGSGGCAGLQVDDEGTSSLEGLAFSLQPHHVDVGQGLVSQADHIRALAEQLVQLAASGGADTRMRIALALQATAASEDEMANELASGAPSQTASESVGENLEVSEHNG